MPTYEYKCAKCGDVFEKFQSMTEPALTVCPKNRCAQKRWGRGKVQRVMSGGAGLIFKGSGFYITDYRSEKYKDAAKKDVPASSSPTGDASKSAGDKKTGADKPASKSAGTATKSDSK